MILNFNPPGPIGAAFMESMNPVNLIMGPIGSGKTSCLMMKTIKLAALQPRSKVDGVRYTKALFIRESYRQLNDTTIPSWHKWMPPTVGDWTGGNGSPGCHKIQFRLPDTSVVDLEVNFVPLGENNVEDLMKGYEFNLLNLNEADTLVGDVLSQGVLRVMQGRYPGGMHVDPKDCIKQVNGDFNAPDIENYLYKLLIENKPDDYGYFRQPGGLDADAENRAYATEADYRAMEKSLLAQGREDLVRRNIHNQWGFTREGKPVYPEYRDDFHCYGGELLPVKELAVRCDFDQGLKPAVILRQMMPNGQLRVLDELYCEDGAKGLCRLLKRVMASQKYAGCRFIGGQCDPAAAARDGNEAQSWVDVVNKEMGWIGDKRVRLAETNNPERRQAAVRLRLRTNVDDGQPGLLISTTCRVMRKGFNSAYHFKKKRGSNETEDRPHKVFPVADVHDALQYGALDDGGYEEVIGIKRRESSGSYDNFVVPVEVSLW